MLARGEQETSRDGGQIRWVWSRDEREMSGGDRLRGCPDEAVDVVLAFHTGGPACRLGRPASGPLSCP